MGQEEANDGDHTATTGRIEYLHNLNTVFYVRISYIFIRIYSNASERARASKRNATDQ